MRALDESVRRWGRALAVAESNAEDVFLMSDTVVNGLPTSKGREFGAGPTVVMANERVAKKLSTTTLKGDACAFVSHQMVSATRGLGAARWQQPSSRALWFAPRRHSQGRRHANLLVVSQVCRVHVDRAGTVPGCAWNVLQQASQVRG